MAKQKVLVQWIGHSDLRALAASLPAAKRNKILDEIKGEAARDGDQGPTKTLLSSQRFDDVRLLSNYHSEWNKWFQTWLSTPTKLVEGSKGDSQLLMTAHRSLAWLPHRLRLSFRWESGGHRCEVTHGVVYCWIAAVQNELQPVCGGGT